MISFIIGMIVIGFMLWLGFTLTGAFLSAAIWLFIKMPIALILWLMGVICCCLIVLIPVGIIFFKAGCRLMIPGSMI